MIKNHLLLLNDYLKDSSPLRLSLFVSMINPQFKLDKKSTLQVESLIADYKLDQNKNRLKMIETFILGNSRSDGKFRPSKAKKIAKGEIIETKEEIEEIKQLSDDEKEADLIRKQLGAIYSSGYWSTSPSLRQQVDELKMKLRPIEARLGMYDVVSPDKSRLDVIFGIFGHWDDPLSLAYELFHGNRAIIQIKSNQDVRTAINDMIRLSGKTMRQFYITNNEMAGGVKGVMHRPTWTLTDSNLAAAPKNPNFVTMIDGKISNKDLTGAAQSPNLNGASWAQK